MTDFFADDFFVDGRGSSAFGARLLASYAVGGASLTRSRVQPAAGMRFVPAGSRVGLREISLPVHIFGQSPREAQQQKSALDAALLADPAELYLPDGFLYTASCDSIGEVTEYSQDGCILAGSYKLSGFRHDPLETVHLPAGGGAFLAKGTAPDMECRLTCTVGTASDSYLMAGILWVDVKAGDVLVLDGIRRKVTRNDENALNQTDLTQWPLLAPGPNIMTAPDAMTVEYYPIYL